MHIEQAEALLREVAATFNLQYEDVYRCVSDQMKAIDRTNEAKLARAIAAAAMRAGVYNGEVALTGPDLLQLLDDMSNICASIGVPSAPERCPFCGDEGLKCETPDAADKCLNTSKGWVWGPPDQGADEHLCCLCQGGACTAGQGCEALTNKVSNLPRGELTEEEWRAEAAAAGSRPANCAPGSHDWDIENGMCRKCFASVPVPGNCTQCGRQLRLDGNCVECNFAPARL